MELVLALISHTNVGKTTLARTLLARDVGEVRDAPHVTEFVEESLLLRDASGSHALVIADTPGFGDSRRLVARMRAQGHPLGWFLSQVWDRWRDRAFWGSQQALRAVRERADAVLYLVNASEGDAGHVEPEMELLAWIDRPVLVLLNQLGPPREPQVEAAEVQRWRERLRRWPAVRDVLPLDAFARCWVHEAALWEAVRAVLPRDEQRQAMVALIEAWRVRVEAVFDASMAALADSLAAALLTRVPSADEAQARRALVAGADEEARRTVAELLRLHGLPGSAETAVMQRLAVHTAWHRRIGEGRAAVLGAAVSGALAGLKADIATGGLTLGGGLLAGGVLGALGAAGVARGFNLARGTGRSYAGWPPQALRPLAEALLLRYLAVAHFGRGRGAWEEAECPPHWPAALREAIDARGADWDALGASLGRHAAQGDEGRDACAAAVRPLLAAAARQVLSASIPRAGGSGPLPPSPLPPG